MACIAFEGRLHCTTSEVSFGPQLRDDDEANALIGHIYRTQGRDPRAGVDLVAALAELRSGVADAMPTHPRTLCLCGSGKMFTRREFSRRGCTTHCGSCNGTVVPEGHEARRI